MEFEQKITPEQEREQLKEKLVAVSSERAKDILKEHLKQRPEQVLEPGTLISPAEREEIARKITDPFFEEKRQKLGLFLSLVEERGVLNVESIVKDADPSLEDDFHDLLIQYLREEKNIK